MENAFCVGDSVKINGRYPVADIHDRRNDGSIIRKYSLSAGSEGHVRARAPWGLKGFVYEIEFSDGETGWILPTRLELIVNDVQDLFVTSLIMGATASFFGSFFMTLL